MYWDANCAAWTIEQALWVHVQWAVDRLAQVLFHGQWVLWHLSACVTAQLHKLASRQHVLRPHCSKKPPHAQHLLCTQPKQQVNSFRVKMPWRVHLNKWGKQTVGIPHWQSASGRYSLNKSPPSLVWHIASVEWICNLQQGSATAQDVCASHAIPATWVPWYIRDMLMPNHVKNLLSPPTSFLTSIFWAGACILTHQGRLMKWRYCKDEK